MLGVCNRIFFYVILIIQVKSSPLSGIGNPLIIYVTNTEPFHDQIIIENYGAEADSYETDDYEDKIEEDAKDMFFNYLRTSPDEDPDVQYEKQFLRDALRTRCEKVDKCVKKCPEKKIECPKECKKELDTNDLCEPPEKPKDKKDDCDKPKRGKTMPPRWINNEDKFDDDDNKN